MSPCWVTYVLPHVLLWNPIQQFPNLQVSCVYGYCSQFPLSLKHGRIGQTHSLQPRVTDYTILLVSAVYKCPVGHESSSTDPRIIEVVGKHNLPFILLHKTGLTKSFEESVIELVKQGLTLKSIESYGKQMRSRYIASKAVMV